MLLSVNRTPAIPRKSSESPQRVLKSLIAVLRNPLQTGDVVDSIPTAPTFAFAPLAGTDRNDPRGGPRPRCGAQPMSPLDQARRSSDLRDMSGLPPNSCRDVQRRERSKRATRRPQLSRPLCCLARKINERLCCWLMVVRFFRVVIATGVGTVDGSIVTRLRTPRRSGLVAFPIPLPCRS